jgi:hypothetical protein
VGFIALLVLTPAFSIGTAVGSKPAAPVGPAGQSTPLTTAVSEPPPRYDPAMAYDQKDGYVVMFGGNDNDYPNGYLNDTWAFSGGSWRNITSGIAPPARDSAALTYDAKDGYILLFGGAGVTPKGSPVYFHDTWRFSHGTWKNVTAKAVNSTNTPSGRVGEGLAYDSADRYVVMFGGALQTNVGFLNDTWTFGHGIWTNITKGASPSVRWAPAMTYDNLDGYVMLFGGSKLVNVTWAYPGDTWRFLHGTWTNTSPSLSPSARSGSTETYDAKTGFVLLYGGNGPAGCSFWCGDTWSFLRGVWTNITPAVSPASVHTYPPNVAYDSRDGYAVMFQLHYGPGANLHVETWLWVDRAWVQLPVATPSARGSPAMAYDSKDHYSVLFGGAPAGVASNDTWVFTGSGWQNVTPSISPPARWGAAMTYDAKDGYVILFGGSEATGSYLNDTWKFVGGLWTNITTAVAPEPRNYPGVAYDSADRYVVLFGGWVPVTGVVNDTWTFSHGTWSRLTPVLSPSPRNTVAMTYDAKDGYIVMFSGSSLLNDTWTFRSGSWTQSSPAHSPAGRSNSLMVYDGADGYAVLFGGTGSSGYLNDSWTFSRGVWTQLATPFGPSPRSTAGGCYDSTDGFVLMFGGNLPTTYTNETWEFTARSWGQL